MSDAGSRGLLRELVDELREDLAVGRVTLRDASVLADFRVTFEATAEGVRTIGDDRAVDVARQPVVQQLLNGRGMVIQADARAELDDPAFHQMLDNYGIDAQIVAAIHLGGHVAALLSVHHGGGRRDWSEAEVERVKQAVTAIEQIFERDRAHRAAPGDRGLILAEAKALVESSLAEASRLSVGASIAIVDAGGHTVLKLRMDDAPVISVRMAEDKAYTAAVAQMRTADLQGLSQPGAPLFGLASVEAGRIIVFGGGLPLRRGGRLVGGVGVSGGTVEQDEAIAAAAAEHWEQL